MIVNKNKFRLTAAEVLMLALSAAFTVGIRVWFPVCEPMGESFMNCHWAGEVLKAASVVLLVLTAALSLCVPDIKMKIGMNIPIVGLCALMYLIPGRIISLCRMEQMQCRDKTQPATIIFMLAMILTTIADICILAFCEGRQRHKREKV